MLTSRKMAFRALAGALLFLSSGCTLMTGEKDQVVSSQAIAFLDTVLQQETLWCREKEIPLLVRYELRDIRPHLMAQRGFLCQAADQDPRLFEAAVDYLAKNRPFVTTDSLSPILEDFVVVGKQWPGFDTRQKFEEIRTLRESYPQSPYFTLSLPGFSLDGSVAVFYFSSYSGGSIIGRQHDGYGFHAYEMVLDSWENREWRLGLPWKH